MKCVPWTNGRNPNQKVTLTWARDISNVLEVGNDIFTPITYSKAVARNTMKCLLSAAILRELNVGLNSVGSLFYEPVHVGDRVRHVSEVVEGASFTGSYLEQRSAKKLWVISYILFTQYQINLNLRDHWKSLCETTKYFPRIEVYTGRGLSLEIKVYIGD